MAVYHTHLQYHKDLVKKREITEDDLCFLMKLQKEMNTQDTQAQADPRFWVIKGSEKIYYVEENVDGWELFCEDNPETVLAANLQELYQFIQNDILEEFNKVVKYPFKISFTKRGRIRISNEYDAYEGINGCIDWLNLHCPEGRRYIRVWYRKIDKIYSDTLFLTQKAAEEHLRANAHDYSKDAHTYAMTAWRSPEVVSLYKILHEVDFTSIIPCCVEKRKNRRVKNITDKIYQKVLEKYQKSGRAELSYSFFDFPCPEIPGVEIFKLYAKLQKDINGDEILRVKDIQISEEGDNKVFGGTVIPLEDGEFSSTRGNTFEEYLLHNFGCYHFTDIQLDGNKIVSGTITDII